MVKNLLYISYNPSFQKQKIQKIPKPKTPSVPNPVTPTGCNCSTLPCVATHFPPLENQNPIDHPRPYSTRRTLHHRLDAGVWRPDRTCLSFTPPYSFSPFFSTLL